MQANSVGSPRQLDLNVEPVWMQGINGSGVVVGVVDDGENKEREEKHFVVLRTCDTFNFSHKLNWKQHVE